MKCYRCKKDLPTSAFYARAQAKQRPHVRRAYSGYCKHCQYIYLKHRRIPEWEDTNIGDKWKS